MSELLAMPGKGCHAHKQVAKVAMEMAAATYEYYAQRDNEWYAKYPSQDAYVKEAWPLFLREARATLAQLLTTQMAEELKEQIHHALILDASLQRGREGKLQAKMGLK